MKRTCSIVTMPEDLSKSYCFQFWGFIYILQTFSNFDIITSRSIQLILHHDTILYARGGQLAAREPSPTLVTL